MANEVLTRKLFDKFGFKLFDSGTMNLNIFGIRSYSKLDSFDDLICVVFKDDNGWVTKAFSATTDAGAAVLGQNPSNPKGTAVLPQSTVCGKQYRFVMGAHHGEYPALNQATEFSVVRDSNKDGKFLTRKEIAALVKAGKVDTGYHGINVHHANDKMLSQVVGNWSHGCQVIQSITDWKLFWSIIEKASKKYGDKFTYTLFDEEDLKAATGLSVKDFQKSLNA